MANELVERGAGTVVPVASKDQILRLDRTLKEARQEISEAERGENDMLKALTLARATQSVREQLQPLMGDVMQLVGSSLGIKTDRDNQPSGGQYSVEVVRDAVLSGLMRGARVVGNEMNVIGGNLYLTKEYWERKFKEAPGVSHVQPPALGIPRSQKLGDKDYALVQCRLDWRMNGKPDHLELTNEKAILVTWNRGMGVDALHGKAKKRLYQMAYARVTGELLEDDEDTPAIGEIGKELSPAGPVADPSHVVEESPPAAATKQRVEDLIRDVEGMLCSLDSIIDCQKTGDHYKRGIVDAGSRDEYTEAEACGLIKVITGLVESRVAEIRKSRGQRKTG